MGIILMCSRCAVVVLLSLLITLALAALIPATSPTAPGWSCDCDHLYYYALAAGQPTRAPFVWRMLHPALARLSGLPLSTAFHALTILWLILLGPATYFMLRSARIEPVYSAIGALLVYSLRWIAPYNLSDPYLVDPLAFVFLVLAIAFAYRRQAAWFMLCLAIGVLAKESVLIAIPVWWAIND
jgi:hypothetical protein